MELNDVLREPIVENFNNPDINIVLIKLCMGNNM
jgi:hypothetical protein